MKIMPLGVTAALLLGGSILAAPTAQAWDSNASSQSSSPQASGGTNMASNGQSQLDIRNVQQELKQAGLYNGSVDGIWGPQSRAALAQYQRDHQLQSTGQLDTPTLQALRTDQSMNASGSSGMGSGDASIGSSGSVRSDLSNSGSSRDRVSPSPSSGGMNPQ